MSEIIDFPKMNHKSAFDSDRDYFNHLINTRTFFKIHPKNIHDQIFTSVAFNLLEWWGTNENNTWLRMVAYDLRTKEKMNIFTVNHKYIAYIEEAIKNVSQAR